MAQSPEFREHYKNGRFFNPGIAPRSSISFLKWIRYRQAGPWRSFVEPLPGRKQPPGRVEGSDFLVTFVNHSTVLLQTEGVNILTDPIWSNRASPVQWVGPKRHHGVGIRFTELPRIDAILLSHNHYDHLDKSTLRRLLARDQPAIFCPLGVGKLLNKIGFREIYELDWWQNRPWRQLTIHCVPAQHFSSRTPLDRNRTLWCGWAAECASGEIYFAGDTGFGEHFASIAARFRNLRLALLPIGAYKPEWFMNPVHMNPDQALQAYAILRARAAVAIHFGTFSLANDGETDPTDRLRELLASSPEAESFWILREGESREVPPAPFGGEDEKML